MTIPAVRRTSLPEARPAAGRVFVALVAVITVIAVGIMTLFAGPASASPRVGAQNAVGVIAHDGGQRVGPHEGIRPGEGRARAPNYDRTMVGSCVGAEAEALAPSSVRLSQSSVNGAADIAESMRANGWVGEPIDVVRMPDGGFTAIDNTRVIAANEAGIDVQANIHAFDEMLPEDYIGRFTTPKGGAPSTWGDAIMNRIGAQNSIYRNTYPYGSPFTGWNGS